MAMLELLVVVVLAKEVDNIVVSVENIVRIVVVVDTVVIFYKSIDTFFHKQVLSILISKVGLRIVVETMPPKVYEYSMLNEYIHY